MNTPKISLQPLLYWSFSQRLFLKHFPKYLTKVQLHEDPAFVFQTKKLKKAKRILSFGKFPSQRTHPKSLVDSSCTNLLKTHSRTLKFIGSGFTAKVVSTLPRILAIPLSFDHPKEWKYLIRARECRVLGISGFSGVSQNSRLVHRLLLSFPKLKLLRIETELATRQTLMEKALGDYFQQGTHKLGIKLQIHQNNNFDYQSSQNFYNLLADRICFLTLSGSKSQDVIDLTINNYESFTHLKKLEISINSSENLAFLSKVRFFPKLKTFNLSVQNLGRQTQSLLEYFTVPRVIEELRLNVTHWNFNLSETTADQQESYLSFINKFSGLNSLRELALNIDYSNIDIETTQYLANDIGRRMINPDKIAFLFPPTEKFASINMDSFNVSSFFSSIKQSLEGIKTIELRNKQFKLGEGWLGLQVPVASLKKMSFIGNIVAEDKNQISSFLNYVNSSKKFDVKKDPIHMTLGKMIVNSQESIDEIISQIKKSRHLRGFLQIGTTKLPFKGSALLFRNDVTIDWKTKSKLTQDKAKSSKRVLVSAGKMKSAHESCKF